MDFTCANLDPSPILVISGLIADRDIVNCLESVSTEHRLQPNLTLIEVNQQYFRKYWSHVVNHRSFISLNGNPIKIFKIRIVLQTMIGFYCHW
jgi:hypothetical protein